MLDRQETQEVLRSFIANVLNDARVNLRNSNANASGRLSKSLEGDLKVNPNSLEVDILMEKYGKFMDQGVSGTERKFNTPYSFKKGIQNRPSPKHFNGWIVKKGLAPRDERGRFTARKALSFAIATSIQKKGIKPRLFLTKAFEKNIKTLPEEIVEAYALDVESFINLTIN
tara:strand:- start:210 stop:722 length:513 start_codon:yes stop_codon:yes gene_type:complete